MNNTEHIRGISERRLSEPGVRLTLTFGIMIIVTAAVAAYLLVCTVFFAVAPDVLMSDDASAVSRFNAVAIPVILAVIIPLCGGYRVAAAAVCRGQRPELALMFSPFSSPRRFFHACLSTLIPLIRLLLPVIPAVILISVAASPGLIPEAGEIMYYCISGGLILVCIPLSVIYFRATRGLVIVPHLLADNPDTKLRTAAAVGKACTDIAGLRATRKLYFSYTGLVLLSVCTLFIVALFHTLPLMSLASEYNAAVIFETYQNERSVK